MSTSLVAEDLRTTMRDRERSFTLAIDRLTLAEGEAAGLTGPSGTGKTLLLELLGLLRQPDPGGRYAQCQGGGEVDLARLWSATGGSSRLARMRGSLFGFVPQNGGLITFLNVRDNIELSQRICRRPNPGLVRALMEKLGLSSLARLMPSQLSIGQRQRVSIARALAHRPQFIIADEPTAALDPENAAGAMALLLESAQVQGSSLIISSHDIALLDALPLTRYRLEAASEADGASVTSRLVRQEGRQ